MSEPLVPAVPAEPAPAAPLDWEAEAKKWKETSLKIEARANTAAAEAKANADAARKLKEFEDRDLSELQKLQRDRDELSGKLTPLQQENARLLVALDKGMPKELAARLQGSTPEELAADADALMALIGSPAPVPVPGVPQPRPDLSQGPRPLDARTADEAEFAQHEKFLFPHLRK